MVIEMADRSMQSPKGIIKNVLVKINKFIFPIDFIILDKIEDDKVPIILGRPMLATAHTRIDVFGKKISLEVGTEQITFDINERESPAVISLVYVINNFSKINKIDEPRNLEDLLMSDDIDKDLGSFLKDNDLLPDLESQDIMSLLPPGYGYIKNRKKTVKSGKHGHENQKSTKKVKTRSQSGQIMVNKSQQGPQKSIFTLQVSPKSKNSPSPLIGL
ncbi:putative reverse transcriptase domain-containing protein [Tanacetum coccineum]